MITGQLLLFYDWKKGKLVLQTEDNKEELNSQPERYFDWSIEEMYCNLSSTSAREELIHDQANLDAVNRAIGLTDLQIKSKNDRDLIMYNYYSIHGNVAEQNAARNYWNERRARPAQPKPIPDRKPKDISAEDWAERKKEYKIRKEAVDSAYKVWEDNGGPKRFNDAWTIYEPHWLAMEKRINHMRDRHHTYCGVTRIDIEWALRRDEEFSVHTLLKYFKRLNSAGVPVDMDLFEQQVLALEANNG